MPLAGCVCGEENWLSFCSFNFHSAGHPKKMVISSQFVWGIGRIQLWELELEGK